MAKNGLKISHTPKRVGGVCRVKNLASHQKKLIFFIFLAVDTGELRDDLIEYLTAITEGKCVVAHGFSREFFYEYIERPADSSKYIVLDLLTMWGKRGYQDASV